MATMRFADEVVAPDELGEDVIPQDGRKLEKREIDMAKQLIDSLTADFEPGKYHDTYREQVLQLVEAKAQGQEVVSEPPPEKAAPVVDLMSALEASLAAVKEKGETEDTTQEKRRATS